MDEERVIQKIGELDQRVGNVENKMLTKEDGDRIMTTLDGIVKIVTKIDQENQFGTEWLKRLQDEVDDQKEVIQKQQSEIEKIKEKVGIA